MPALNPNPMQAGSAVAPTHGEDAVFHVLAQLGIAALAVDADGAVTWRSQAAERLVGPVDHLESMVSDGEPPAGVRAYGEHLRESDLAGVSRGRMLVRPAAARTPRMVGVTFVPLRADEPVLHSLVVLDDDSERIALQERVASAERLTALGKLAARVAHELNNPLDGILRYINLSLRVLKEPGDPRVCGYLQESKTGLLRMAGIVRELLEFSRASKGQFDITAINDVADQAIREYASRAAEHGVVIAADFQALDLPGVRGNRLYQVCCNLIKNAIDAMPEGGRLTVTTGRLGETAVLRVADTGVGLPDDGQRLFEPFFTTKEAGKGTGLGLAICREYVEEMGGTISAASVEGGGVVFTIRLPLARCQPVSTDDVARGVPVGAGGEGRQP